MDKIKMFLNKYNNSSLKAELMQTAPFFSEIIEKYIVAVCSKYNVTNQFINSLLEIEFKFAKREKHTQHSRIKEDFGKNFNEHKKVIEFHYRDEHILTHQIPDGLTEEQILNYKARAYKDIIIFIHEVNHATGINCFCKLDKTFKKVGATEIKQILESSNFLYRKKSGFYIERYTKNLKQVANVEDLLYEATTEVLAHKLINLSIFDDVKYVSHNGKRKHSYSLPFSYEPIASIIILFSYINKDIFSSYFSNSVTANVKKTWDEVYNVAKEMCFCDYGINKIKDKKSKEFYNLVNKIIAEANEIIKYFYNVATSKGLPEKQNDALLAELKVGFANKKLWRGVLEVEDDEKVEKALENLLTIEELEDNTTPKP